MALETAMLMPPGFCQQSVMTSLGRLVYYLPESMLAAESPASVVFLHGFGGGSSAYEWSKVYPAFALSHRVLAPDLIGWGRSDHPARNYQVEDYVTNIIEFLERTCTAPVPVVASSLTAAFTIKAAIARPDLFQCLILTIPSGLADFGRDYRQNNFFASLVSVPFLDRLIYSVGIATREGIRNFLEQRQFARPERIFPELVEAYLESAQQPNAEYAALSFVRGDLCFDLALELPKLTVPTAIIWGAKAQFTTPETGQRLADLNPQAVRVFQVLEDVGLTPQLEEPAIAIALIQRYLSLLLV